MEIVHAAMVAEGSRRKGKEPSLSLLQVLRALPAGFFFGWAAPKKNQKSSAFYLGRLHSTAKNLIQSGLLPNQVAEAAP